MDTWENTYASLGKIPTPPYIASILNYYLSDRLEGYQEYDELTLDLAKKMPGY